jgi:hypothetical protein
MSLKERIARWLAPDAFRTVQRYHYLRDQLSEAQMWLGYEFPDVDAAIMWAKVSEVNHFQALSDPSVEAVPGKPWIWAIWDFRDHLRAMRSTPPGRTASSDGAARVRERSASTEQNPSTTKAHKPDGEP